jgi:hypothetical protein
MGGEGGDPPTPLLLFFRRGSPPTHVSGPEGGTPSLIRSYEGSRPWEWWEQAEPRDRMQINVISAGFDPAFLGSVILGIIILIQALVVRHEIHPDYKDDTGGDGPGRIDGDAPGSPYQHGNNERYWGKKGGGEL